MCTSFPARGNQTLMQGTRTIEISRRSSGSRLNALEISEVIQPPSLQTGSTPQSQRTSSPLVFYNFIFPQVGINGEVNPTYLW